ncbi:flagellar basal body rod protein FlgC [Bosea sp. BK604]|uniref:flagellar basal body rod protein FlgC n=1 Tax=Bosea sp. BK604 TaxID=2512180 RepID=UPI00105123F5|nr:flagellar basal body rod protein FlgC [Bosea sp. BK604]TCR63673.1 flagellar basal-body rod protein FlgC [Bosea sp. BK604]
MIDPIDASLRIAGAGLQAQSTRVRIVSENLANAQSTGRTPGSDPYRRKTVTFENAMNSALGASLVKVKGVGVDKSPFRTEFEPGNPAADDKGFVKLPNVSMLLEMADMREANRSYEANLQMIKQARSMQSMTIDLLRNG